MARMASREAAAGGGRCVRGRAAWRASRAVAGVCEGRRRPALARAKHDGPTAGLLSLARRLQGGTLARAAAGLCEGGRRGWHVRGWAAAGAGEGGRRGARRATRCSPSLARVLCSPQRVPTSSPNHVDRNAYIAVPAFPPCSMGLCSLHQPVLFQPPRRCFVPALSRGGRRLGDSRGGPALILEFFVRCRSKEED